MHEAANIIGVFDSGLGGVSILRHLAAELPHEQFCYYGDAAHAPYGIRSKENICELSTSIVEHFCAQHAKAVVIACNTATAAAASYIRATYPELVVVGVEPALKPAVLAHPQGHVLVMATHATLHLEKFAHLMDTWADKAQVSTVVGEGLVELIESGQAHSAQMLETLERLIGSYRGKIDAVVLGCTHYPFIGDEIRQVLGAEVELFDGGAGTAKQLRSQLAAAGLLAPACAHCSIQFESSSHDPREPERYERMCRYGA